MFTTGQIVISKCGRDRGIKFVVVEVTDEFLMLVDGSYRTVDKPKKKKKKHVQRTFSVCGELKSMIDEKRGGLCDADFRKAIAQTPVCNKEE